MWMYCCLSYSFLLNFMFSLSIVISLFCSPWPTTGIILNNLTPSVPGILGSKNCPIMVIRNYPWLLILIINWTSSKQQLQEGTELSLSSEAADVLQHLQGDDEDLWWAMPFLYCCVLGRRTQ